MILWKLKTKKGQVAPFMILIVALLILAIAATMLIGEAAFNRIRLANVVDGALISTASAFCRSLNQIHQISFGGGGLLIHYIALQVFLLSTMWPYKGAPLATGFFINSMLESRRLYREAERIAREAPKDLRINLWDRAFGGGLIDEPKPFLASEVNPDGKLDYNAYLNRDSNLTLRWRAYKEAYPSDGDAWYKGDLYSYSYNKTKERVVPPGTPSGETTGILTQGEPLVGYESYIRTQLNDAPSNVSVRPQRMIMIYFYCAKGICGLPGFLYHPYAWIMRINIDHTGFGLSVRKLSYFQRVPFFGRNVVSEHTNRIRIQGSVWSGYEPRLEQ